jgi:hypothetical protein
MTYYKIASGSTITAPMAGDLLGIYRQQNSEDNRLEYLVVEGSTSILVNASVSAAATDLLSVGSSPVTQTFTFAAGGGAYVYNIDLSKTLLNGQAIVAGAIFNINITKAASTNPTINIRNGSGGSNIISINNASAQNWATQFMYDGTNWNRLVAVVNTL